ncbi:MAG TPA: T9SS type A sorting domain-containing protein [Lentimicrobium sp.]|nr:T9SS type A sorting domain-containing protein [Lentimicrobium sp.]
MKKLYSLVVVLLIGKCVLAQDSIIMLPPQNLQGYNPENTDYAELHWEAPSVVPSSSFRSPNSADTVAIEDLSGYNVYRDNVLIATVDAGTLQYFDLEPEILFPHEYHVSALYDLTEYGFPGETGESAWEGPVSITIIYCGCNLPFYEEFNTGLFTTNQWDTGEGNWQISGQAGNQAPSAMFNSIPAVSDYSQSLTSYWLSGNVSNAPDIFLDFDLKLATINIDRTEKMYIDIFRSSVWTNVAVYENTGSTGWDRKSINITEEAYGDYFKFRFRAEGLSTTNIQNWQIDNIHVYDKIPEPTGVNEPEPESSLFYPNPATSMITLSYGSEFEQIEIFNLLGKRLLVMKLRANETHIPLSVASLKNGVYLVKFTGHLSKTLVRKLIVQK